MISRRRRALRHADAFLEIAGYVFWMFVDFVSAISMTSVLAPLTGGIVATIVMLRRRPGFALVPVAATAIGTSLAFSLAFVNPLVRAVLGGPEGGVLSFTEQLALAIVVIVVLRRCQLRVALVLTALAAVAIVGSPLLRMTSLGANGFAAFSAVGWGGAVAIGLVLRELDNRRTASMEEVRTSERMELARELHDVVAHHVTGIVVAAQAAAVVARTSPEDVDRALSSIEAAGTDALAAMRRMVGVLRGEDSDGARTPGAELRDLHTLAERFDPQGSTVRLRSDPGLEHAVLPAGVAATGYRVVQEALTNARRHAPQATTVEIDVHVQEGNLVVAVRNDGTERGPRRQGPGGFGLIGMSERVSALGGTLRAGPAGADIWAVEAWLPLRGRAG